MSVALDWIDKLRMRTLSKKECRHFSIRRGMGQLSCVCLRFDLTHKLFKALDFSLKFAARFTVRQLEFFLMALWI